MGNAFKQQSKLDDAIEAYRKAIKLLILLSKKNKPGFIKDYDHLTLKDELDKYASDQENKICGELAGYGDYGELLLKINGISIYPNPADNIISIDGNFTILDIYDVFGKLVYTTKNDKTINTTILQYGVYFIDADTENGNIVKKIFISH